MAYYAFLDENNNVIKVITGKDENDIDGLPEGFSSWEEWYGNYKGMTCKRTSYNTSQNLHKEGGTPFRGNFATVGGKYDAVNDIFVNQPHASWTLDLDTATYNAPIEMPDDGNSYRWNEDSHQLDNSTGWELIN